MSDVTAWRTVPRHHLTAYQRFIEKVFGGAWLWCPEVTARREWARDIRRAGR